MCISRLSKHGHQFSKHGNQFITCLHSCVNKFEEYVLPLREQDYKLEIIIFRSITSATRQLDSSRPLTAAIAVSYASDLLVSVFMLQNCFVSFTYIWDYFRTLEK